MKKRKVKKYALIGTITIVLGILSFMMYQSYGYYKVNYTGNIINTIVAPFGSYEFNIAWSAQEFIVPVNGYYEIELWGAQGRNAYDTNNPGGKGGYTKGIIYLEQNEKLYIYVGHHVNGFNGGGAGYGMIGGGATDIRLINGTWDNSTSLRSRIMVASGVALSTSTITGGAGGGILGFDGTNGSAGSTFGYGATQLFGGAGGVGSGSEPTKYIYNATNGSFGKGGFGGRRDIATDGSAEIYGGGGGGGYYGGGGGGGTDSASPYGSSGGGGSSYISGYAGVNSVQETGGTVAQPLHTNNTKHYSNKYFLNGKMEPGVNEGDGKAKITYVSSDLPQKTTVKLNNVRYIKSCIQESTLTASDVWIELQAIKDGVNVAKGKSVLSTVVEGPTNPYSRITDGIIGKDEEHLARPSVNGAQCITVDLGTTYDLDEVALWNYYGDERIFGYNHLSVGASYIADLTPLSTILHNYPRNVGYVGIPEGRRYTAWDPVIEDSSNNNFDGTLMGASIVNDNGLNALSFDGVDDYVMVPTLPATINWSSGFTIDFEVKFESVNTAANRILDFGKDIQERIIIFNYTLNDLRLYLSNSDTTFLEYAVNNALDLNVKNKYTYKVYPISGTNYFVELYKNGVLVNQTQFDAPNFLRNIERTSNFIGKSNSGLLDGYFKGKIYDLKISLANNDTVLWYKLN